MDKKKRYKLGFSWGKREHKYERIASRLLWIGTLFVVGGIVEYYTLGHYILCLVALLPFFLAFLVHLVARVSHRVEKYTMDQVRSNRK